MVPLGPGRVGIILVPLGPGRVGIILVPLGPGRVGIILVPLGPGRVGIILVPLGPGRVGIIGLKVFLLWKQIIHSLNEKYIFYCDRNRQIAVLEVCIQDHPTICPNHRYWKYQCRSHCHSC